MRNESNGPRQPLSQRRPKAASNARLAARTAKASKAKGPPSAKGMKSAKSATAAAPGRKVAARSAAPAARDPRPAEIYRRLLAAYPDACCALDFHDPFQLLVATILSAQCTDKRVNMVTPALFARYPDAESLAAAQPEELEALIRSTGFFRNKAKSLLGMSAAVVERHGGHVPDDMDALVRLPGVGRKTANVVLGNAFGRNEGVVVDTHVGRVSQRLALTLAGDPVKVEQDLVRLFPRDQWTMLAHLLIEHGRQVCEARRPKCERCVLNDLCPASRV